MLRTRGTDLALIAYFGQPKMATNGRFGHSGKSEVSENSPNEFPMAQNLGIDTKIKSLACSEPKLQILPFSSLFWLTQNGHKWPF